MSSANFTPRQYQIDADTAIHDLWAGGKSNVMAVLPTGAGKTKLMGMVARRRVGHGLAVAHRKELVGQISFAMAELGVTHRVIGADGTVRNCVQRHIKGFGRSYIDPNATFTVAAVDTLLNRAEALAQWRSEVRLVMIDEAHHVLENNKWGKTFSLFPNALGLGVTATPLRADRKALGRGQGGLFDDMHVGPTMRDLIDMGALCDYRIFAPPVSIDRATLDVGSTGDFTPNSMRKAAHESKIVGDIVGHYERLTPGKRAICFVVDVEQSKEVAAAFRAVGYKAEAVDGTTPEAIRDSVIDKFARGLIDILVNVDLFGEGFDVPAVEVVIMGRPTESYGLYVQQFGRALRTLPGKQFGVIIDHVDNVHRHGLPDSPRRWALWNEERGRKKERDPDAIRVTACIRCFSAYEAFRVCCPFCGYKPEPMGRSRPDQVDGDLVELDPEVLEQMRKAAAAIMEASPIKVVDGRSKVMNDHWIARTDAQADLRYQMKQWSFAQKQKGLSDSEIMRLFYQTQGVDMMSALSLSTPEATALTEKLR